ncbi:hypothetical protein MRX96_043051 [Rhipicephalus microplus]
MFRGQVHLVYCKLLCYSTYLHVIQVYIASLASLLRLRSFRSTSSAECTKCYNVGRDLRRLTQCISAQPLPRLAPLAFSIHCHKALNHDEVPGFVCVPKIQIHRVYNCLPFRCNYTLKSEVQSVYV